MIDCLINRSFRSGQHGRAHCLAPFSAHHLSALLKRTAAITQTGAGSQTIRSRTVAFETLRCVIEVVYLFASLKQLPQIRAANLFETASYFLCTD